MLSHALSCAAALLLAGADQSPAQPDALELIPVEQNIIYYTNLQRQRYGLPEMMPDANLLRSARAQAVWMTTYRTLQHTNQPVAENIAMGQQSSQEAVASWMASPGHRANILDGSHRRIGAAAYRTPEGTIFWCQQFSP